MQTILQEARKLTKVLVETYEPEQVILFGSGARGTAHAHSDIDLLIIKK